MIGGKIEWKIIFKLRTTSYDAYQKWSAYPNKGQRRWHHNSQKPEVFTAEDYKMMEKNVKVKKLLYFGLGPDEYTRIFECESAKDIWEALQVAHEGIN